MSWGWPKGRTRKEGGPFTHIIDFRISEDTWKKLGKVEGGEKGRSGFLREIIEDALDTLDPPMESIPSTLNPCAYWRMADHKLKEVCPALHAILPATPPRLPLPNFIYRLSESAAKASPPVYADAQGHDAFFPSGELVYGRLGQEQHEETVPDADTEYSHGLGVTPTQLSLTPTTAGVEGYTMESARSATSVTLRASVSGVVTKWSVVA